MPYIKKNRREDIRCQNIIPENAGELNYQLTTEILKYIEYVEERGLKKGYTLYNEVIGVLECAKLEFYRRLVAEYEDVKIAENGDIHNRDGNFI